VGLGQSAPAQIDDVIRGLKKETAKRAIAHNKEQKKKKKCCKAGCTAISWLIRENLLLKTFPKLGLYRVRGGGQ